MCADAITHPDLKRCSMCMALKPFSDFTVDRSVRDGRCRYCRECHRTRVTNTCERCGAEFKRAVRQRYCGLSCRSLAHAMYGPRHPTFKGRVAHANGYIKVWMPGHPMAGADGYVLEHRLVAAQVLGRMLRSDEHVHHLNHNRADNRPENLEVMSAAEHMAHHGDDRTLDPDVRAKHKREYGRAWRAKNSDHVKAYRAARRAAGSPWSRA